MAIAAQLPEWVDEVVDDLDAEFGAGPAARGRAYAEQGRVLELVAGSRGEVLVATVRGSGRAQYQALIQAERDRTGLLWGTSCSCPVGSDCKHVVAALLEASRRRQRMAPQPCGAVLPDWETALAPLVRPPQTAAGTSFEFALLLEWRSAGALPQPGEEVRLRPARRGRSGRWIKSGMSWNSVRFGGGLPPPTQAAYRAIVKLADVHRSGHYGYPDPPVQLAALGASAPRLLADAEVAGIALVPPRQAVPVRVSRSRLRPHLNVVRTEDGGLVLSAAWRDKERDIAAIRLLGDPPTVALYGGDPVVVAPLEEVDPAAMSLLGAGRLTIPPQDAPRFLTSYYPILHRRMDVGSSDGSCPPPVAVRPRLWLEACYQGDHRLRLRWGFAYRDGVDAVRFPLEPSLQLADGLVGAEMPVAGIAPAVGTAVEAMQDPDDEAALLTQAVAILGRHVPATICPHGSRGCPQPYSPFGLTGMDTAVFTSDALPELQAVDLLDVTVVGEPASYQLVEQAPNVRFGVEQSDAGNDWFDLDISVEVAGEQVAFRPLFAALVRGEKQLLLDSGTWFHLDRPELARLRVLIEEARALSDRPGPLRITRWQAGLWDELTDLGVVESQSAAWTRCVGGLLDPAEWEPMPSPVGLEGSLRPYQLDGYRWLSHLWEHRLGGILADDMGLGKTAQALAAILNRRENQASAGGDPVLVVTPTSVIGTWLAEAAKFTPGLRVAAITETATRRGVGLEEIRAEADVVVTSYALVRIEADDYRSCPWAAVLLDEAQFVKNPRGKTHQAVRSLDAPVKVAMTGTPLENSLMDLWALLAITAPGLFPSAEAFTQSYRRPIESGSDPEALARLQRRLRPLMLRRTKDLVAPELPAKQEQVRRIALSSAHQRIYDRHLARERQRVLGMLADFDRNRIAIFRSLTLLRQLALAPALLDGDRAGADVAATKIDAFAEQIAEVAAEGHRALVFSQFTGFLRLVRERLDCDGIGYAYLDGRTRNRSARIAAWRSGTAPVFLISLKAGGFGLTLTEADYVFVLDPWWNPAAEAQAIDRTHRIGQDKTVMVYRLIAEGTIEEKVLVLQERKRELFTRVVESGGSVDGVLTASDIRSLVEE